MFVRGAAADLGRYGIRINAICPAWGMSANFALGPTDDVIGLSYEESEVAAGDGVGSGVVPRPVEGRTASEPAGQRLRRAVPRVRRDRVHVRRVLRHRRRRQHVADLRQPEDPLRERHEVIVPGTRGRGRCANARMPSLKSSLRTASSSVSASRSSASARLPVRPRCTSCLARLTATVGACRELLDHLLHRSVERAVVDHLAHETPVRREGAVDPHAAQDHLLGSCHADQPGQQERRTAVGREAARHERHPELRRARRDDMVARQRPASCRSPRRSPARR